MAIVSSAFSQRGTAKAHNEDALLLCGEVHQGSVRKTTVHPQTQAIYFAIADGIAISTQPRIASRRLLELLELRLAETEPNASMAALLNKVRNDYVSLRSNPDLKGMASTLVGVRLIANTASIFHVGDSRAYLISEDSGVARARLLTRDHSELNEMVEAGEILPDEAESSASFLRGLTSQFTVDSECDLFKVGTVTHLLQPGERLVLCSDGLNEMLSDAQIAELLCRDSAVEGLLQACKAARKAGGTDDFSVIVLTTEPSDKA